MEVGEGTFAVWGLDIERWTCSNFGYNLLRFSVDDFKLNGSVFRQRASIAVGKECPDLLKRRWLRLIGRCGISVNLNDLDWTLENVLRIGSECRLD